MIHNCNRSGSNEPMVSIVPCKPNLNIVPNSTFNFQSSSKSIDYDNYTETRITGREYCFFVQRYHKRNTQTRRIFQNKTHGAMYTIFQCNDISCSKKIKYFGDKKIGIKWPHIFKDFPLKLDVVIQIERVLNQIINKERVVLCPVYNMSHSSIKRFPLFNLFGKESFFKLQDSYCELHSLKNITCTKCNHVASICIRCTKFNIYVTCCRSSCNLSMHFTL